MSTANERHIRKEDEEGRERMGRRACEAGRQRHQKWLSRTQPCDVEPQRRKFHRKGRRTDCNMATERKRRKRGGRVLNERPAMQRRSKFVCHAKTRRATGRQ